MFDAVGALSFSKRARSELRATGGRAPAAPNTTSALTSQETMVARLANERADKPGDRGQLFLSPHTVDYHLRKVFRKLDISGRGGLRKIAV